MTWIATVLGMRQRPKGNRRLLALGAIALGVVLALVAVLTASGGGGGVQKLNPGRDRRGAESLGGVSNAGTTGSRAGAGKRADGGTRAGAGAGLATAEPAEVRRLIKLGRPIYCAGDRGNEIALTFDDGPGPYTRLALAKLRKHGERATFFIVGRNIKLVPGITRRERALGAVGDHTFTHPLLTALPAAEARQEMVSTQTLLEGASGGPVFLFRPPYGGRDATIDAIAHSRGMLEVLWTVDSADSLGANYAGIERNVIGGLRPGAIILMHENHGQTIRAMLNIFAAIARRHLRAVSVPELLSDDPPSTAQVLAGGRGCGAHVGTPGGG